jgi:hypothetical protein
MTRVITVALVVITSKLASPRRDLLSFKLLFQLKVQRKKKQKKKNQLNLMKKESLLSRKSNLNTKMFQLIVKFSTPMTVSTQSSIRMTNQVKLRSTSHSKTIRVRWSKSVVVLTKLNSMKEARLLTTL